MRHLTLTATLTLSAMIACGPPAAQKPDAKDRQTVAQQQAQYGIAQPIPMYDYSLERDLLIQLYNLRNTEVSTHSVWRSLNGDVLFDCPSMGYGIPYDTSLTNPIAPVFKGGYESRAGVGIGQAEPNGIFASQNTSATWVMCLGPSGSLMPHYVEATVEVFPYPVTVDYNTGRVQPAGTATATIRTGQEHTPAPSLQVVQEVQ